LQGDADAATSTGKETGTVDYRFLGRTGLKVSELCLGAMTFGSETDEATSHQMLDRFVDAGGNFIDTADVYAQGRSEEILGSWLQSHDRDSLVIATKAYGDMGSGPNDGGGSRKHLLAAVEASLRRLGTDYVDLYQMHVFDDATPLEETLSTTPSSAAARSATSGPATTPPGSCRRRSTWPARTAWSRTHACSRSTTCSTATPNSSSCPSA
jgi:Aldo/keto reductase family